LEEALELVAGLRRDARIVTSWLITFLAAMWARKGRKSAAVRVTLSALCLAQGIDDDAEAEKELTRITHPEIMQKIRIKQASKPGNRSPLPQ